MDSGERDFWGGQKHTVTRDCLGMYRRVMRRFVQEESGCFSFFTITFLIFDFILLASVVVVVVLDCNVVTAHLGCHLFSVLCVQKVSTC